MKRFRIWYGTFDDSVVAFMPDDAANRCNISSYMHIGQHGEASIDFMLECKKASKDQRANLEKELKFIYSDMDTTVITLERKPTWYRN